MIETKSPAYVIGPSNVGKSSACEALAALNPGVQYLDSDVVLGRQSEERSLIDVSQDWSVVGPFLDGLETELTESQRLVAIGAGLQDIDRVVGNSRLAHWLGARSDRVICLQASQDELFARNVAHANNRDRFDELEFGAARCQIYGVARWTVDCDGLDVVEVALRLQALVNLIEPLNVFDI